MSDEDTPETITEDNSGDESLDASDELTPSQLIALDSFDTKLSGKGCPQSLRTLLVRLRRMQLLGGYTQQEPAKRFAPPYRTPATIPPSYHKVGPDGALKVDRRRVNEDMTGGRHGSITMPPEQLVRYCVQVYLERRTNADGDRLMAELLRLRKTAVSDTQQVERQGRGLTQDARLRDLDSAQVRELREEADRRRLTITDLQAQLEQVQDDKTVLQDWVAGLSTTLMTMTSTGQQQTQQISDLHTELNSMRDKLVEKDHQITRLIARLKLADDPLADVLAAADKAVSALGAHQRETLTERDTQTTRRNGLLAYTYTRPAEDGAPSTEVLDRHHRNRETNNGAGEPARNAPCPCGSGKKYKRCHGAPIVAGH